MSGEIIYSVDYQKSFIAIFLNLSFFYSIFFLFSPKFFPHWICSNYYNMKKKSVIKTKLKTACKYCYLSFKFHDFLLGFFKLRQTPSLTDLDRHQLLLELSNLVFVTIFIFRGGGILIRFDDELLKQSKNNNLNSIFFLITILK